MPSPPGAARFVSVQNELSLLERADETDGLAGAAELGLGLHPVLPAGERRAHRQVPAWRAAARRAPGSPTTRSRSATRSSTGSTRYARFAEDRGHTLLELAIGWLLSHEPVASVITGATRPEQIESNASAATWRLDPEEMAAVAALG